MSRCGAGTDTDTEELQFGLSLRASVFREVTF